MRPRRVVITGLGPVTSIGVGKTAFSAALQNGDTGISPVRANTVQGFAAKNGGEVHDFRPEEWIHHLPVKSVGRCAALAIAAARLALQDAGLEENGPWTQHCGVCVGTTDGEANATDELVAVLVGSSLANVPAENFQLASAERLAELVAAELGLLGEAMTIGTACAAGNYAIGNAYDLICEGDTSVALAGGADAISRKAFAGFSRLGAVAESTCRPFDLHRQGMIPAEGAAMLVLEEIEHARSRGARIYAEVLGYGLSCDAKHPTSPDADSISQCIRRSHQRAGVTPNEVDYVCAHGTGTRINDAVEVKALHAVFGDQVPPTSSIKSMLGHTMGAASAMGAVASTLAIAEGFLPPTINFVTPDPDCDIDCVPNKSRPLHVTVAQNNGFAFAGNNAILMLGSLARNN